MNWIDYLICIFLFFGIYRGFTKGFIIQIASVLAILLALFGGVRLTDFVSRFLISKFELQTSFISIIAFTCVFICIVITVFTLAKFLEVLVKITMLSLLNKIAGAILGLFKYLLLIVFFIYLVNSYNKKLDLYSDTITQKSKFYNPAVRFSSGIIRFYGDNKNILNQYQSVYISPNTKLE